MAEHVGPISGLGQLFTLAETNRKFRGSITKWRRLVRSREIRHYRIGTHIFLAERDIVAYLEANSTPAAGAAPAPMAVDAPTAAA